VKLYTAPQSLEPVWGNRFPSIFLGGSIEMGKAQPWQEEVITALDKYNLFLLNPRRTEWDASWEQSVTNPQFKEQVIWEQEALMSATHAFFYIDPDTMSPITLLEIGQIFGAGLASVSMTLVCPKGFWRRGNLEVMAEHEGITLFETLDAGIEELQDLFHRYQTT
jgi:hypothetical protein